MSFWTDMVGGGNSMQYSNPEQGITQNAINNLENSNTGEKEAQDASRAIGRRYNNEVDSLKSNPNISGNAAVLSGLENQASESASAGTASAYEKGAAVDTESQAKAGSLGLQAGQLGNEINQGNYERQQDQSFGHSFAGGLLKDAVGFATGMGEQSLFGGGGGDGGATESSAAITKQTDSDLLDATS